jgi:hypothetical protein
MRRRIQALFFAMLLCSTAIAGEVGYRAHTPTQSPFEVIGSEIPTARQSSLEYRGRATIRVKYRFVYGSDRNLHLDLLPESKSQSILPFLTRWANESGTSENKVMVTDTPKEIWVTNVTDAAVALLGAGLADEMLAGKYENVYGEALVVIDGFVADYTCISALFSTEFLKVETVITAPLPTRGRLVIARR